MKRFLIAALATVIPLSAQAGFGVTHHSSIETTKSYFSPNHLLPSIDYKSGPLVVQVDALELIESLGQEDQLRLGFNVYQTSIKKKVTEEFGGVVQFGGSLDFDQQSQDLSYINVMAGMRMGAQAAKGMGFGIYVVPQIGLSVANGDAADVVRPDSTMELELGGQLQISTWLAK
ncbi:MAG: hypothetical protein P8R54_05180 [Myxococcota bacterium]|nr:hypothetical protein [Myxococcota bacterium]